MRFLFALVPVTLTTALAQTPLTVTPVDPGIHGMSLFGPDSAEFKAYVNSKITTDQMPRFEAIMPYSVVLRNDTSQPILGYQIEFSVVDAGGRHINLGHYGGFQIEQIALPPGGATWIAIDGIYSSMLNSSNTRSFVKFIAGEIPAHEQRPVAYYNSARSVSVWLDSILMADGTIVGPDQLDMTGKFAAQLQGDLSISQAVLGFKNNAMGLQQFLEDEEKSRPDGSYEKREAARQARLISATLRRRGLDAALAQAAELYQGASGPRIQKGN